MCQPGRPRPQGESQPGISGVDGFHKTKSWAAFLVGRNLDTRARDHLAQVALGELAVFVVRSDIEQHVTFGLIRVAFVDQRLDHRDHHVDVLRGVRLDVRWRTPSAPMSSL